MKENYNQIINEFEIYQDNRDAYSMEERKIIIKYFKVKLKEADNFRDSNLDI